MNAIVETEPLAYTISEAAHLTRLSTRTVRRAIQSGRLQSVHVGRAVRIPRASLIAMFSPARKTEVKVE